MFAVDKFKIKVIEEKKDFGSFEIEPFPSGFGITMGNALRRILLSSIEGACITSVSVSGVKHEYASLPGVYDDVITIVMRLKQLAIRCHSDEPQTIELDVKGKKKVTAKDIKLTSEVEILNPELELTELTTTKAKLQISMQVEKGTGYTLSDESKRSQVGVLPVDTNYSPVKRVGLKVSKTRVGQQVDLDKIQVDIYTNGAIEPSDALEQAAETYNTATKRLLAVVKGEEIDEEDVEEPVPESQEETKQAQSSDLDIDKLNLTARLTNSLLKAGYKNLTELEGMSLEEIMEIRGLGQRSSEELFDFMKTYKLNVKE
jgi:DNA-directed RNA polymerase subunit alpha